MLTRPIVKYFLIIFLWALAIFSFFYIKKCDLLRPGNFDDNTYTYILGSSGISDGSSFPRFVHPGLSSVFILSWYFTFLKSLGTVHVFSITDFIRSDNPLRDALQLFLWGKLFSIFLAVIYLLLLYVIAQKISNSKIISASIVMYNLLMLGLFEQMMVVRPELLSGVFILCAIATCLWFKNTAKTVPFLIAMGLFGFFISLGLWTKIMVLFFSPLFLYFLVPFLTKDYKLDRRRYFICVAVLSLLNIILAWDWVRVFTLVDLQSIFPQGHRDQIKNLYVLAKAGVLLAGASFFITAFFLLFDSRYQKLVSWLRTVVLGCLAFFAGAWGTSVMFYANGAKHAGGFAHKIVLTAIGETFFFNTQLCGKHPPFDLRFFLNHEIIYLFTNKLLFVAVLLAGLLLSGPKQRVKLVLLFLLLWFFSCAIAMRGYEKIFYYYQLYFMIIISFIMMVALKSMSERLQQPGILFLAVLVFCSLFLTDVFRAAQYREKRIFTLCNVQNDYTRWEYWGRSFFIDQVLRPHYCQGIANHDACLAEIEKRAAHEEEMLK